MSLSAEEMDTLREAVAALDTQVAERVIAKLQQLEEAKLKELVSAPDALSELVGAIARKTQDAMAKEAKKARKAKLKEDDGLKLASSSSDHTTRAATCLPGPTDISESSRATHLPAVPPKLVPRHSRTLNINVGVLGHVDSGKTSLTRALSTVGSTASFDKHPQSKERGITLDLGFSSFSMGMPDHLRDEPYDRMQITLVDCPGHSSLIRTIIGGAQIIDLMILVVDAGKGIQTQTAECLVIGEITNDTLIVVLNKVDVFPIATRNEAISKIKARVQKTLASTKFADAPMVEVAARPGGGDIHDPLATEIVPPRTAAEIGNTGGNTSDAMIAASEAHPDGDEEHVVMKDDGSAKGGIVGSSGIVGNGGKGGGPVAPLGIAELLDAIKRRVRIPHRDPDGPLLFAIDHCFPIKGQGTVLTGTVLNGSMKVGMEIDFPELKQQRKIKSMQIFKKPIQHASQGDRVGVCVTQLDAKLLERGIACTHGHVTLVSAALVSVRQIRFFKSACKSGSKFHFTVGHTTVMVTATFFGPPRPEGYSAIRAEAGVAVSEAEKASAHDKAVELARTPLHTTFDATAEYGHQNELDSDDADQWAVIQFECPVPCALPAIGIGSHLDGATTSTACRLAFYGRMLRAITNEELRSLSIFKRKSKEGQIDRVQDAHTLICKGLFKPGTDMKLFGGMQVQLGECGPIGRIDGTFGKTKFKCVFPDFQDGVEGLQAACHRAKLHLKYKRLVFDPAKRMIQ